MDQIPAKECTVINFGERFLQESLSFKEKKKESIPELIWNFDKIFQTIEKHWINRDNKKRFISILAVSEAQMLWTAPLNLKDE
ncbi:hypothetical protein [Algoriphagus lacus]|uniref:hypothetical protein n=1 Tax=Algoriphagus lacus TaxID=2056311 RepID=UPI0011C46A44|nr:hypothetical protein [Algoriphagus lacus]